MFGKKVTEAGYEVIQSDGQSTVFKASHKFFAICTSHTGFTVYQVIKNGLDWQFLPGSKNGKSFKTVTNFVKSRS